MLQNSQVQKFVEEDIQIEMKLLTKVVSQTETSVVINLNN